MTYVSIHGKRFGLVGNGVLRVDGQDVYGGVPNLGGSVFVDSVTGSDNDTGLTPQNALATLDAGFAKCTADKGWTIYVLPKHAETVTGAGGIAHDVAGVSVIGIGHGFQRPTFLMDGGTSVTYKITANDAFVHNLWFNGGHASVVTCIDVQGAKDAHIDGCYFQQNTSSENFVTCVKAGDGTNNAEDGLTVTNNVWFHIDTASLEMIEITGDLDHFTATGNIMQHEGTGLSPLIVVTNGDNIQYATIADNITRSKDTGAAIGILQSDQTDNTGILARNLCAHLDTQNERIATGEVTGLYYYENFTSSVVVKRGYILPARDA